MKNIKPLGNRILVKRAEAVKTKGGIFLPDSAQEKPRQGEVVAVGPGRADDEGKVTSVAVRVGQIVLYSSYAGTQVQDTDYLIMNEDDILAIVD